MKKANEVRAKHVFGELTMKDILPIVAECDSVTIEVDDEDNLQELTEAPFRIDKRKRWVNVYETKEDFDNDEGLYLLYPESKVKVRSDCVEYFGRQCDLKLTFFRDGKPFVFKILNPCGIG